MYHAVEGVRILLELGLDAVREHSLSLTSLAIERADAAGLPLRSPRDPAARSAMILLEVPAAEQLTAYLKTHDIYTDSRRNEIVRMAPFLWNTETEVHRTFDRIEKGLGTGDYREVTVSSTGPVT
jgi:kynureninase